MKAQKFDKAEDKAGNLFTDASYDLEKETEGLSCEARNFCRIGYKLCKA